MKAGFVFFRSPAARPRPMGEGSPAALVRHFGDRPPRPCPAIEHNLRRRGRHSGSMHDGRPFGTIEALLTDVRVHMSGSRRFAEPGARLRRLPLCERRRACSAGPLGCRSLTDPEGTPVLPAVNAAARLGSRLCNGCIPLAEPRPVRKRRRKVLTADHFTSGKCW